MSADREPEQRSDGEPEPYRPPLLDAEGVSGSRVVVIGVIIILVGLLLCLIALRALT
ncbi:hypothetical protein [Janibacter sp. GXQ6167]|uniref:hypothetical protein n=1 Tax=Janibacter sp. GXQ6167 TaxID=3240791 RepID=UPI0035269CC1